MIRRIWGDKCISCGKIGCIAHHIIPKNKRPDLALNIDNGITFCVQCHALHHKRSKTNPL